MNQIGPIGPGKKGNTRPSSSLEWCFTFNNYTEDNHLKILQICKNGPIKEYVIGQEMGEKGTPHLQGWIKFSKRLRPMETFKEFKTIHWEKAKGSKEENINYCSKDGKYETNCDIEEPLKIIESDKLYAWQIDIVNIVKETPDERTIYWFWEPEGCAGKTTLAKYLSHHYRAVPVSGKRNDVLYVAAEFKSKCYIFDLERTMEEFVSYAAMEKIKDGYFMCSKYESKPVIRNSPHVICFANFAPDTSKLSKDRWKIRKLS